MLSSKFFWKLYAGYVALILVTTVVVGYLATRRLGDDLREDLRETLSSDAALLSEIAGSILPAELSVEDLAAEQERIVQLGKETGTRFTVISLAGVVLADSHRDPAGMDNHADRVEIVLARNRGGGFSTRFSETLLTDMLYHARAVSHGMESVGYARAALPTSRVQERMEQLRLTVLLGAGITALVALALGYLVARKVTLPLSTMTQVAGAIASGEYDRRVTAASSDEIGQLASAFNRMAEQLNERIETVTRERNKVVTILSAMVEGVVAIDRKGGLIHMNEAAGRILGANPKKSVGKPLLDVTRATEVCESLLATGSDGEERRGEVSLRGTGRGGSESEVIIETYTAPLRDGAGVAVGAVLILHDVTQLRHLEVVRKDFVANVSHELKTPVTAIRALADTLKDSDGMDDDTRGRFLGKIQNQTAVLASLINDLLTLSRVDSAGEGVLEHRPLDLLRLSLDARQCVQPVADEVGVDIETRLPERGVTVLGDEDALRGVLGNLLDNAVRYTPEGGKVELRVFTRNDSAVIEVQDNGIGIEPEHLERIFERFYRVDKARSRQLGGTGLGLSIVKHFVASLGGKVAVESEPGVGSRFRVELPLS